MDFTWECFFYTMVTCSSFLLVPNYSFSSFLSCKEKEFRVLCLRSIENTELNCCENSSTLCPKNHWHNFLATWKSNSNFGLSSALSILEMQWREAGKQWNFPSNDSSECTGVAYPPVDAFIYWMILILDLTKLCAKPLGWVGNPSVSSIQFMLNQGF